ncbi:MAG: hydrolase [Chromatocurvus sp.]
MTRCSQTLLCVLALALALPQTGAAFGQAVLDGIVSSEAEGVMEGVVVIATPETGSRSVAVTSGADGRFSFPANRLPAGRYKVGVRAAGWELAGGIRSLDIPRPEAIGPLQLTLQPVADRDTLASQLTSLAWVNSFPGTLAEKDLLTRNMVNCAFCHSLEQVARSAHDAEAFMAVIQRMKTYETDHSSGTRIQVVATPEPLEGLEWYGRDARELADYLARINLSEGRETWDYALKPLPRPTGEGTRAVVTVFPVPRQPSVIHDLDVDESGNVWYGNTGWDFLGRLDPQSGEFSEWPAPNFLPPAQGDLDRIVGVQDIQVDSYGNVWVAVMGNKHAAFDRETERWRIFDLPVIWKNPFLSPLREGEITLWGSGVTAPPEGDNLNEHAYGLNTRSGELSDGVALFDSLSTPTSPTHRNQRNYCYMFDQDAEGNFLCTASETSAIVRINDAGEVRHIPTPTPNSYPRRGYRDDDNRFWFSEFFADRVGMIDLDTDEITEFPLSPRYISPYFTRPDRNGNIWISSTGSDRLLRLDPDSGNVTTYLMPVYYDSRKLVLDESADRITVWLPNKNRGELIRVEILD